MGLIKRIVLIIKSYAHSANNRIEMLAAEEELRHAAGIHKTSPKSDSIDPISDASPAKVHSHATNQLSTDYLLLGIKPGSDLDTIESAWRRLALRADPKRFPSGSDEEKKAAEILKSINEAYERVREAMNPTEGRFGQLEL